MCQDMETREQIPPLNPTSLFSFLPIGSGPRTCGPRVHVFQDSRVTFSWSSPESPSLSNGGGISGASSSTENQWQALQGGQGNRPGTIWTWGWNTGMSSGLESHLMPDY